VIPVVPDQNGGPNLVHDWARRVLGLDISGTIQAMSHQRESALPLLGTYDDEPLEPRRVSRSSALLVGLALLCAAATVVFGIWMAGVVPSASIG
jgi:hypothetical protein